MKFFIESWMTTGDKIFFISMYILMGIQGLLLIGAFYTAYTGMFCINN